MTKRSTVSLNTIIKSLKILAPHPWIINKLIALQLAKWFFPFPHFRAGQGYAGKIHQLSIRITDMCNLRCHTCGQWGDSGFMHGRDLQALRKAEVTPERYLEIFRELVANGHRPNVYLWGGEPMLYKGIMPVIEGATQLGLPVSIATNGYTLADSAERLAQIPLFLLQISIDGDNREIHNNSRPSAAGGDSFGAIEKGLAAIRQAKNSHRSSLPLVASLTVISKQNVNRLVDIFHTFKDSVDIFVFYLSWWIDQNRAKQHEEDFQRRFGEIPKLHWGWIGNWQADDFTLLSSQLTKLQDLARSRTTPAVTIIPNLSSVEDLKRYYTNHSDNFGYSQCISIYQAAELHSNGNMSPCRDYHDFIVGNVKETSIIELWNSSRYRTFRKSLRRDGLMPVCSRCCGLMGY